MTYRTEFPHYKSAIPDVFLKAPWEDASWHNDATPCFSRRIGPAEWDKQVHVYVDEEKVEDRNYYWTASDSDSGARYSVRFTDEKGVYTDDSLDFHSDSLADVLDRIKEPNHRG